ncbi:unnamed protein product [Notodromas monacha]|uniref:Mediator of RNA polymerase II transcription subunit 15 n=1 Tax=Notodromas monacha TaxID=399045 RepID=A0A7R9BL17_9CRUS|nr:unnamed protein product [Notodromas monacha]CAG0917441.1 unnamed protein product [Notodromas monacha]
MAEQDDSWRTPALRQKVLSEIDEVINASGNPAGKSSQDMENHIFQKASSREEYLSFVARVIIHMREMNDRSMSASNPHLAAALNAPNSSGTGDMWNTGGNNPGGQVAGQGVMVGQMSMLQNQLGGGVQNTQGGQSMLQSQLNQPMHRGPMQHPMRMNANPMMNQGPGGVSQLQNQLSQPSQLHARLTQPSQLQSQLQSGMDGSGGMRMQIQTQPQQGPGQMVGSQLQNQLSQPPRGMNVPMGTTQFIGQNVVRGPGAMMPQSGPMRPTRARMPAGMRGVQQMNVMGPRPAGQVPQMQHMPRQQQMKPDSLMGMMGGNVNVSSQPMNMGNTPQPMYATAQGGPRPIMMNATSAGDKASTMGMMPNMSPQSQVSSGMHMQQVNSPMVPSPSLHVVSSPMPQPQRPGYQGSTMQGNVPINAGGPGIIRPSVPEDSPYLEKIRQLSKFVEPLQRMIAKLDDDDTDKMTKMKKLMDILTNPNTQVPMDTLLKCEQVLEKIVFSKGEMIGPSGPGSVPPPLSAATPTSIAGPPSVPTLEPTAGPPSNLPSLGSVPTPGPSQPNSAPPPSSTAGGGPPNAAPNAGVQGPPMDKASSGGAGGPPAVLAPPPNLPNMMTRDQQVLFGPLLETIASTLKSQFFNHTMERTFGQCMEALFGPEIRLPERTTVSFEDTLSDDESEDTVMLGGDECDDFERSDIPDALRREICGKDPEQYSFKRIQDLEFPSGHIVVECHLLDSKAPLVPPILIYVPRNYPEDSPPFCNSELPGYDKSTYLLNVKKDMLDRLKKLPERNTLSHILHVWEMSVRHAASVPMWLSNIHEGSKAKLFGKV